MFQKYDGGETTMSRFIWSLTIILTLSLVFSTIGLVLANDNKQLDRIAGYEVLMVKNSADTPCLGKTSSDLILRASQGTVGNFQAGNNVAAVMKYLRDNGFSEDTGISFVGPEITRAQLEYEHARWNQTQIDQECLQLVGQSTSHIQPGYAVVVDTEIGLFTDHNAQSVELLAPTVGNNQSFFSAYLNNGITTAADLLQEGFLFQYGIGTTTWTDENHGLSPQPFGILYQPNHWYWFTITYTSGVWQICGYDINVGTGSYVCHLSPSTDGIRLTGGDNTSVWFENQNSNSNWYVGFSTNVYARAARNYVSGIPSSWSTEVQEKTYCGVDGPDGGTIGGTLVSYGTANFNLSGVPLIC